MSNNNPIVVIEDDRDEQYLLDTVFKKLNYKNEIIYFFNPDTALEYLKNIVEPPFLILCDVNMPLHNGISFRDKVHLDPVLKDKCMPWIFFTNDTSKQTIRDAYCNSVQGFFRKEIDLTKLQQTIEIIVNYWYRCLTPNNS